MNPFMSKCPDTAIHTPYLSALDFCNSPVLNIQFDELDLLSISNLNFTDYSRQKNSVQTGKKNPVHQTQYFRLENCKNQVQIDGGEET